MPDPGDVANLDPRVVEHFGKEWSRYDQEGIDRKELERVFGLYFLVFPWDELPPDAEGFDLGCGSGRWAGFVAPRVGRLHCIDPSPEALDVARRRLARAGNCSFHEAGIAAIPLADASQDFGYALGVLHAVPDPAAGLRSCVEKLKPGAPFLLYLYYAFEIRPLWFRMVWRGTDLLRRGISRLPTGPRHLATRMIAAGVYWPLARACRLLAAAGMDVHRIPLSFYRDKSFYMMANDALDRFGTGIEFRYTRDGIEGLMRAAGLERIRFSPEAPYWCAVGHRADDPA